MKAISLRLAEWFWLAVVACIQWERHKQPMNTEIDLVYSDRFYAVLSSLQRLSSIDLDSDISVASSPRLMDVVVEYARLNGSTQLTIEDQDLLDRILEAAQENELLDFWLSEVDHILSHQQGDLDEDAREFYKDQYAVLREYIGMKGFQFVIPPTISNPSTLEESSNVDQNIDPQLARKYLTDCFNQARKKTGGAV
jgi:hypothetical protein